MGKKIKLKGMLFQNLYKDILVSQKLKTKHENSLINSIEDVVVYFLINKSKVKFFLKFFLQINKSMLITTKK